MKRKSIWIIIILMSFALIGIIFIQIYWINLFVRLNEKNFDDRVYVAINKVKEEITESVQDPISLQSYRNSNIFQDDNTILDPKYGKALSKYDAFTRKKLAYEIRSLNEDFNPKELLYKVQPETLDKLIKDAISDQGIDLDYDYGLFSTESKEFFMINGNYVPVIDNTAEASNIETFKSLDNTKYRVQLFTTEFENPGYLAIFFKNKTGFLWSSVIPWLVGSVLFTGLILFCFSYVLYVVFRQKKVSEMKNDFINNMTHEFKTPIATISLASDSINSNKIISSPDKIKRFVNIIKQENTRMLSQVEKVLQMAQIEKQDFELKMSDFNFEDLIKQVIEHTKLKVRAREGSITTDFNFTNPVIHADKTHISNIIHNLLDNANKYSSEPPVIHVKANDTDQGVYFSIQDQGIGMTKDSIKYIFDKFYRVHTGNLHDVKGFGLGLSYVKVMVEAHRGQVTVDSNIGKGSTFDVFIPRGNVKSLEE